MHALAKFEAKSKFKNPKSELEPGLSLMAAAMVLSLAVLLFFFIFLYLLESFLWKPERLRAKLRKQGIGGPTPSFLIGNVSEIKKIGALTSAAKNTEAHSIAHGWASNPFPHLEVWRNRYGNRF